MVGFLVVYLRILQVKSNLTWSSFPWLELDRTQGTSLPITIPWEISMSPVCLKACRVLLTKPFSERNVLENGWIQMIRDIEKSFLSFMFSSLNILLNEWKNEIDFKPNMQTCHSACDPNAIKQILSKTFPVYFNSCLLQKNQIILISYEEKFVKLLLFLIFLFIISF